MAVDRPRRLIRPPRYFTRGDADRPTGLELFFDLVFVFCVAQLARLLREDPTWATAGVVLLLFVPVWWTWVGVTFCTDRFPTDDVLERLLVLVAAGAVGAMGLALTGMPGSGSVEFAVGYATVRLVLVALYARAGRAVPELAGQARWYVVGFAATAVTWLASIAVPTPARWVVWAVAMLIDVGVPAVGDRIRGLLPVDVHHLPDRFAAFVIIVLGESVTTTASLVAEDAAPGPDRTELLVAGFLLATGLWWGFFDRGAWRRRYSRLEGDDGGRLANIVCAYLHFPLVLGVTLTAAGIQTTVAHGSASVGDAAAFALTGGIALYLLALNLMTLVLRVPRPESLVRPRFALVAVLAALAAAGPSWNPVVFVALCALVLLVHVGLNLGRARNHPFAGG